MKKVEKDIVWNVNYNLGGMTGYVTKVSGVATKEEAIKAVTDIYGVDAVNSISAVLLEVNIWENNFDESLFSEKTVAGL